MRQSWKLGGKKSCASLAMLPESRKRSPGRISAPRHDHARSATSAAHASAVPRECLGGAACSAPGAAALNSVLDLSERGKLRVDVGELLGLLVGRERGIRRDLGAVLEELELADRHELRVGRRAEPAVVVDVLQHHLLALVVLAVVQHEAADLL